MHSNQFHHCSSILAFNNHACDGCKVYPILHKRYHCNLCPDFDLCIDCYSNPYFEHEHSEFQEVKATQLLKSAVETSKPNNETSKPNIEFQLKKKELESKALTYMNQSFDRLIKMFEKQIPQKNQPKFNANLPQKTNSEGVDENYQYLQKLAKDKTCQLQLQKCTANCSDILFWNKRQNRNICMERNKNNSFTSAQLWAYQMNKKLRNYQFVVGASSFGQVKISVAEKKKY